MMAKLESAPAQRLEDGVKESVVRVRTALAGWTGRPAVLGKEALELLEEVQRRVSALNQAHKKERLEEQVAERAAQRGGRTALAAVRQFHARAHAWMWNQRAERAAEGIPEDPRAEPGIKQST
jgi:hypothetical protein